MVRSAREVFGNGNPQNIANGAGNLPSSSGFSKYRDPRYYRPSSGRPRNEFLSAADVHKWVVKIIGINYYCSYIEGTALYFCRYISEPVFHLPPTTLMIFRCSSEPLTHPIMIHRTYSELPSLSQTKTKDGGPNTFPPLSHPHNDNKHMEGIAASKINVDVEQKSAPGPIETGETSFHELF